MRILVACEESQAVTIELRNLGHEAYSCDIQECSGGHPEGEKECTGCKQSLPYPAFNRNKASRDFYMSKCKKCESDMAKARKANADINYAAFYYPIALD